MGRDEYMAEVLLNEGVITEHQIEQARRLAAQGDMSLIKALRELTFIGADTAARTLAGYLGYDYVDLATAQISSDVLRTMPASEARRLLAIPIALRGNSVVVAVADPMNLDLIDEVQHLLKANIELAVADGDKVIEEIERLYGVQREESATTVEDTTEGDVPSYQQTHVRPTERQLSFLQRLKYEGPAPSTKREASLLIDAVKAQRAADKQSQRPFRGLTSQKVKQLQAKAHREWLKERRKEIREQVRDDLAVQRDFERDLRQCGAMDRRDELAGWLLRIGSQCTEARHLDGLLVTTVDAKSDPGLLPPYDTCREESCECDIEPVTARDVPKGTRIAERE